MSWNGMINSCIKVLFEPGTLPFATWSDIATIHIIHSLVASSPQTTVFIVITCQNTAAMSHSLHLLGPLMQLQCLGQQ